LLSENENQCLEKAEKVVRECKAGIEETMKSSRRLCMKNTGGVVAAKLAARRKSHCTPQMMEILNA